MESKQTTRTPLLLALCVVALVATATTTTFAVAAGRAAGQAEPSEATQSGAAAGLAADEANSGSQSQIVVYYFHGNRRCKTCRTIEAFSDEVMKSRFAKELESGAVAWKVVDYDEPANQHFIEEFGLVSASLVVVEISDGETVRFEILQQAWTLVRDKSGFDQYVRKSVLDYLG